MTKYLVLLVLIAGALYGCEASPSRTKTREENLFIFPGTKWCGKGNDAVSYDDLGENNDTDVCCRAHDHCPFYIPPFQKRYGVFNIFPTHIFKCSCETRFYNCLLKANTPIATTVGRMYFNGIRTPCFDLVKKRVCVESSSWLSWIGFGSCNKYRVKLSGKMSWLTGLMRLFPKRR